MRVTTSSYSETLTTHLQRIAQRQVSLQNQISTGQRVQNPEDDPLAASQVLKLREKSAATVQFQKNIQHHSEQTDVAHGALRSLQRVLDRAQELAYLADGLESKEDLKAFAIEIDQMLKQAIQVANTTHRGEQIFGGTKTDTKPFQTVTDAESRITGVIFEGNTKALETEIAPGVLISSRIAGASPDGTGARGLFVDPREGADIFGHLIALRDHLEAGDTQAVAALRPMLQKDEDNVIQHVATNAALKSRLESSLSSAKEEKLSLQSEISRRADVDLAETIVRLNQSQTNYQAALQSAGSVLNLSLLSFLR
jgi:flagellar hook-associated protein 3 FlgL